MGCGDDDEQAVEVDDGGRGGGDQEFADFGGKGFGPVEKVAFGLHWFELGVIYPMCVWFSMFTWRYVVVVCVEKKAFKKLT